MHKLSNKIIHRSRDGFTLVEMMVAIGLFSILIAVAVGGFAGVLRTERQVSSLIAAQGNVGDTLEEITREVRTGTDFCPVGQTGASLCDCPTTDPTTGALSCSTLAFTNAQGQTVVYELQNGVLEKSSDGGSTYQPVTASNVTIPYFTALIFGNVAGDHWNPRVTIQIGVAPQDPTLSAQVLNLQTTVSARAIDCDASGNC